MNVRYIKRKDINDNAWNNCLQKASNKLLYGYTFYLDAMCDNWDGLVLDDYAAIMPLPWRKKWHFYYLYQPHLVAQGGVFGTDLSSNLLQLFLNAIPAKFTYWDLMLNYGNIFSDTGYNLYVRTNYVLPLHQSYEAIAEGYRTNTKRNIKRGIGYGCFVQKEITLNEIIELVKESTTNTATQADFKKLEILFALLKKKGQALTYGVYGKSKKLLAGALFFYDGKRWYYILAGTHPDGKTLGASHLLIDSFIKDHSNQNAVLDFEGSDVQSLQFFYSGFGAVTEPYAALQLNRLPWYVKWLKK